VSDQNTVLSISNVDKVYSGNVSALENIAIDIKDNEFFTLLGPSGCGKTTLLRIMAGFETPTSGNVLLDGKDIGNEPPFRRPVNTMFQSYALFPHLNVQQNVAYGLEMLKWKKADIDRRVFEVLDLIQMDAFRDRRIGQMSGGQQQRVALARAIAPRPRVLLLDEPLSALDLKLRKAMQVELKRLQKETHLTFVMVTHDQEEALALSDRIAVMSKGRVQQIGTPGEIYSRPANKFVADFIGEANLVAGGLLDENKQLTYVVRPESIDVGSAQYSDARHAAIIVKSLTFLGADTLLEGCFGDGSPVRVRRRGALDEALQGKTVDIHWRRADEWAVSE
jgi:spermidine/putrescine transport system ATP-binding protein